MRKLTETDLAPWARRQLDLAYEERARAKASREDFTEGFIGALLALRSFSSFTREAEEELRQQP
jgi:hypothetical protein